MSQSGAPEAPQSAAVPMMQDSEESFAFDAPELTFHELAFVNMIGSTYVRSEKQADALRLMDFARGFAHWAETPNLGARTLAGAPDALRRAQVASHAFPGTA